MKLSLRQTIKQTFLDLFYKYLDRKHIIILFGNEGALLVACNSGQLMGHLHLSKTEAQILDNYKKFISKYKNLSVYFLLDTDDCKLQHESLPIMQSLVKINPADKFISENFTDDEIIAYNVYDITNDSIETWHTVIASAKLSLLLSDMVAYIANSSLKFGGIYLLPLESIIMIDKILGYTDNKSSTTHLQILTTCTETSGIKLIIKHNSNILVNKTISYPLDKSLEYIQGMIEQEINDHLIAFKNYVQLHQLNVSIILLLEHDLLDLLKKSNFTEHKTIYVRHSEIIGSERINKKFADHSLVHIFSKEKSKPGLNKSLNSLTRVTLFSHLLFKPMALACIILLYFVFSIKWQVYNNERMANQLNDKYYKVSEQYRTIKQKFPNVEKINNLADFYSITTKLDKIIPKPINLLDKFFTTIDDRVKITKINWTLIDNNQYYSLQQAKAEISLKFILPDASKQDALNEFEKVIEKLKSSFKEYDIAYTRTSEKVIYQSGRTIIPAILTFTGPQGSN